MEIIMFYQTNVLNRKIKNLNYHVLSNKRLKQKNQKLELNRKKVMLNVDVRLVIKRAVNIWDNDFKKYVYVVVTSFKRL